MANDGQHIITDDEIARDVAAVKSSSSTREHREDYEQLLKDEVLYSSIRKKYKGQPEARKKFLAGLDQPEKSRFSKIATIGDVEEFKLPDTRSKPPKTLTGRYAAAQLKKAGLLVKAVLDGTLRPDVTEDELKTYRIANGKANARAPVKRLSFSGYDAIKDKADVERVKALSAEIGVEKPKLTPAKPRSPATKDPAAGETSKAADEPAANEASKPEPDSRSRESRPSSPRRSGGVTRPHG